MNESPEGSSSPVEESSSPKASPTPLAKPWAPAKRAHQRGGADARWAGSAFLIFCMDASVAIKILSKGSNFKEEKLA